jgi:hypothetical protein
MRIAERIQFEAVIDALDLQPEIRVEPGCLIQVGHIEHEMVQRVNPDHCLTGPSRASFDHVLYTSP